MLINNSYSLYIAASLTIRMVRRAHHEREEAIRALARSNAHFLLCRVRVNLYFYINKTNGARDIVSYAIRTKKALNFILCFLCLGKLCGMWMLTTSI